MKEYEEILLGTWLRGENLQDLKYVKEDDFADRQLVTDLKAGKNMLQIGTERGDLHKLADLSTFRSDVLYRQSLAEVMSLQIKRDIANMESLDDVYMKIDYLRGITLDDIQEAQDPAVSLLNELNERAKRQTIKWDKLPTLNNLTVGIKRKELTAIAARPSVGKSAFALQIAYGAWKQGAKVLYFPLEMSTDQCFARLLVANKYATAKEIQTGVFQDNAKLQLGIDHIADIDRSKRFKVYEGEGQIEHIESVIKKEKPFVVVIDQLTQLRAKKPFGDIRAKFSYMTSNLKRIAMQENVAVLLLCQINRNADNTKPTMANLKESGSIEEDSDNVILLHRLNAEDLSNADTIDWSTLRPMLLNLAKQRDGETSEFKMMFKPSTFEFYELVKETEYDKSKEYY
jgi:replicative DNA helicase